MNRIALYSHGGSANHGCEAIVRSLVSSLADEFPGERFSLVSLRKEEDEKYMGQDNTDPVPLDIYAENDPFGSRKDRHEKIGEGSIPLEAFRRIVTHPVLLELPFILETPNELPGYAAEIRLLREMRENGK